MHALILLTHRIQVAYIVCNPRKTGELCCIKHFIDRSGLIEAKQHQSNWFRIDCTNQQEAKQILLSNPNIQVKLCLMIGVRLKKPSIYVFLCRMEILLFVRVVIKRITRLVFGFKELLAM